MFYIPTTTGTSTMYRRHFMVFGVTTGLYFNTSIRYMSRCVDLSSEWRVIQVRISHFAAVVPHERLDNWLLFHFLKIHSPPLAIMLENHRAFLFSYSLDQCCQLIIQHHIWRHSLLNTYDHLCKLLGVFQRIRGPAFFRRRLVLPFHRPLQREWRYVRPLWMHVQQQ